MKQTAPDVAYGKRVEMKSLAEYIRSRRVCGLMTKEGEFVKSLD